MRVGKATAISGALTKCGEFDLLEIRRKLKRLKKGETIYDVPDPEPQPETKK